jgi:CheY-like chemotaxis protein
MLPPMQVLLVEDNPVNQKVARSLLEKAGHKVTVAGNGKEALNVLSDSAFDLVLMDVSMPEMDGLEAAQRIRRSEEGKPGRLPIVAFTANTQDGDREKCLAAGMDSYVTKPAHPSMLFQAMAEALHLARQAG